MELIRLGELGGGITERLERVGDVWRDAGFNVKCFDDINQLVWEKFVCNVTYSGSCTIFEVHHRAGAGERARMAGRERLARRKPTRRASRKGSASRSTTRSRTCASSVRKIPNSRPSMLQDYLAKRPSEIDAINGMVPVVAREVGTAAPYNEVVTAIVKAKEQASDSEAAAVNAGAALELEDRRALPRAHAGLGGSLADGSARSSRAASCTTRGACCRIPIYVERAPVPASGTWTATSTSTTTAVTAP